MSAARRSATILGVLAILSLVLAPVVASDPGQRPIASFTYWPCVMCAAPGDVVLFNASYSISPTGNIVSYTWDFGDGTALFTTNSSSVNHMYGGLTGQWQVTLTVLDSNHETDTVTQLVIFNVAPKFTFQPADPETDQMVLFNASSTTIYFQTTQPPKFLWSFGDGSNATGTVVEHIYSSTGVYRLTLFVVTTEGNATISKTVLVVKDPPRAGGGGGGYPD